MTFPRIFLATFLVLFGAIGVAAIWKKPKAPEQSQSANAAVVQSAPIEISLTSLQEKSKPVEVVTPVQATAQSKPQLPDVDNIELLFQKNSGLPIVETVRYKSQVPWKRSRSAWLVDYASHYKTHLHFIARSLNGKRDYTPKAAREGDSFNVLSQTENFYFYLLVDISRCKMWFYYVRPEQNERFLLKTYRVGLGRVDTSRASGCLTPTGTYKLGSRVAVFQPKMMGNHKGQRVELIRVFGTRWIPFEKEIKDCSEPAKSYGIHGTPWQAEAGTDRLVDNPTSVGNYESDGCIRLAQNDIEELFAIISTHDTIIEIVSEFEKAKQNSFDNKD